MRVYDALNSFADYERYLDELAAGLDIRAGEYILDAGCGTGNMAWRLASRGGSVVGLDFSRAALTVLRAKMDLPAVEASLERPLPFADRSFDRVLCLSVLFALSPQGARLALGEFRRVLRPSGRLVVTAMRPGQSRLGFLMTHLRRRAGVCSWPVFLRETARLSGTMAAMLYYNYRMQTLAGRGGYRRFGRTEILSEIRAAGFVEVDYGQAFGGRFHLVSARCPRGTVGPAPGVTSFAGAAVPAWKGSAT